MISQQNIGANCVAKITSKKLTILGNTMQKYFLILLCLLTSACSEMPKGVNIVKSVDANQYLGTWYEIARLDHSFERDLEQVTAQYIKKADGTKFGKSENGNIWLDKKRTSAYKFYQFWLNASDEDIKNYIRIFSLKTKTEIESLEIEQEQARHLRPMQHSLANEITERVHSKQDLEAAQKASKALFDKNFVEKLTELSDEELNDVFEDKAQTKITQSQANELSLMEILSLEDFCFVEKTVEKSTEKSTEITENEQISEKIETISLKKLFASKREIKDLIKGNGIGISNVKLTKPDAKLADFQQIKGKYYIGKKGKEFFLITVGI